MYGDESWYILSGNISGWSGMLLSIRHNNLIARGWFLFPSHNTPPSSSSHEVSEKAKDESLLEQSASVYAVAELRGLCECTVVTLPVKSNRTNSLYAVGTCFASNSVKFVPSQPKLCLLCTTSPCDLNGIRCERSPLPSTMRKCSKLAPLDIVTDTLCSGGSG